jgi:hypothetical protein
MSKAQLQSLPSDEVLRQLQETLLKAVLLSQPLPGSSQPIVFPDLSFIQHQPTIIVLDENLAGPMLIEEVPTPIRRLRRETLRQEASTQGDITYLSFRPSTLEGNAVQLTLEAKIAPRNLKQRVLGLSGIQAKFEEFEGHWEVVDEPIFFAT